MLDDDEGGGVLAFDVTTSELLAACEPVAELLAGLMVMLESIERVDVELPPAIALHVRDEPDPATLPDFELREISLHRLLDAIACRAAADRVPF
jgi:hypothetical protein